MIEGRRETKEQSDTAAIVACDRLSGVLTDAPGAGRWSSPHYLVTHSLTLDCMCDYGSSTVQVHGGLRDRDKARRRSTPVSRVDMTKRSSAARAASPVSSLQSPVISHTLGE